MRLYLSLVLVLLLCSCGCQLESNQLRRSEIADPFIGTGGHGHTYPGASRPFGMVQLSPDTRLEGWDGCSGYHFSDEHIYGFSHTHLSGTGVSDYGDVLLMPTKGEAYLDNGADDQPGYRSAFNKRDEFAEPGYYEVLLKEHQIKVGLTTTPRTGFHRYEFGDSEEANIVLDLVHRDQVLDAKLVKVSNTELHGYRHSNAWATNQQLFFVIRFSQPFTQWGIVNEKREVHLDSLKGNFVKAFFRFKTKKSEPMLVKVGISAVSIEGAQKNLESELPDWDFEAVKKASQEAWKTVFDRIQVKGGSKDDQLKFFTAMYHSYLNPNLYADVDGKYRGMDGAVYEDAESPQYTVFSLWDTYRATHPLFTMLEQERTNEFVRTFLKQYQQGGVLPIWELAANYTGCMIGYHSIPVIADAYLKGIDDFDAALALQAMQHSANLSHLGLESYTRYGYVAADEESESVSKTLEYAYDDWCIAEMARKMGRDSVAQVFSKRGQYYKNLLNPENGFFQARVKHQWFEPFYPEEVNFHYTEANAWQYGFYVPQDVKNFERYLGGKEGLARKLDALFSAPKETSGREQADITGLIGQYAHGNEPSHHIAYLYNYVGQPDKTQKLVQQICNNLYTTEPDGLSGNEDCGQMSSWFVFSALGFYPVTPGSQDYIIGIPLFEEARISLENGNTFTIRSNKEAGKIQYVQGLKLNGMDHPFSYIRHDDIMNGGELVFELGDEPGSWGTSEDAIPVSQIVDPDFVATPFIASGQSTFRDSTVIRLGQIDNDAIYFSTDGADPKENGMQYSGSLKLESDASIRVVARNKAGNWSPEITRVYRKINQDFQIELGSEYANQYNAGGDEALIDYIRGSKDFRTGSWQGYQGVDLIATVDLGSVKTMSSASIGTLQDQRSWIFFPEKVIFSTSEDGKTFSPYGEVLNEIPEKEEGGILQEFTIEKPAKGRFVRIEAVNKNTVPEWHIGAGGKAWIFADEIIIK